MYQSWLSRGGKVWKLVEDGTVQLHLKNTQNRSHDGHSLLLAKPDSRRKLRSIGIFPFYFVELLIKQKTLISIFRHRAAQLS